MEEAKVDVAEVIGIVRNFLADQGLKKTAEMLTQEAGLPQTDELAGRNL